MNAYDIIRRPVITEQSMEAVADKKYVFMVDVNANKTEIKAAVELAFGVKVAKVNTIRMQGKVKRTGAYPAGKRADYKKAIVTLTADSKTIEFFETPTKQRRLSTRAIPKLTATHTSRILLKRASRSHLPALSASPSTRTAR